MPCVQFFFFKYPGLDVTLTKRCVYLSGPNEVLLDIASKLQSKVQMEEDAKEQSRGESGWADIDAPLEEMDSIRTIIAMGDES